MVKRLWMEAVIADCVAGCVAVFAVLLPAAHE
jgi:hypothetical protein